MVYWCPTPIEVAIVKKEHLFPSYSSLFSFFFLMVLFFSFRELVFGGFVTSTNQICSFVYNWFLLSSDRIRVI